MPDLTNVGVVTWIGTSRSPRRYVVPALPEYYPFYLAAHTLVVDVSPQNGHIPDKYGRVSTEDGVLLLECLEMLVRENVEMNLRIDVLRFEGANIGMWPGRRLWAVLGALRPRYLEIVLEEPEMLSFARLSSLSPQAFTSKSQRNAVSDLSDWRYNLKYGTPQLFGNVCGLKIVHPLAIDMFVKICDENPGLATQLKYLGLINPPAARFSHKRDSREFGVALARCATLTHLGLTVSKHDADVPFCRMLPSYLSNVLLDLRIEGPPDMARYCQRWIRCARTKTWLPRLESLACHLGYHGSAETENQQGNDDSELVADPKALAWETKFINAMAEHRPNLQILR